jgi:hypothetical protein
VSIAEPESPIKSRDDVSIDDFITGLIAGLAVNDVEAVNIRGAEFYTAVTKLFERLKSSPAAESLDLRFRIILDETYGDSAVVRDAISGAVQRDLVSLDNPEYLDMRLKVSRAEAEILLHALPGEDSLFEDLAAMLVDDYPWIVVKRRPARY